MFIYIIKKVYAFVYVCILFSSLLLCYCFIYLLIFLSSELFVCVRKIHIRTCKSAGSHIHLHTYTGICTYYEHTCLYTSVWTPTPTHTPTNARTPAYSWTPQTGPNLRNPEPEHSSRSPYRTLMDPLIEPLWIPLKGTLIPHKVPKPLSSRSHMPTSSSLSSSPWRGTSTTLL